MLYEWRSIYIPSFLPVLSTMTEAMAACEQSANPALHAVSTWGRSGGGGVGKGGGRGVERGGEGGLTRALGPLDAILYTSSVP